MAAVSLRFLSDGGVLCRGRRRRPLNVRAQGKGRGSEAEYYDAVVVGSGVGGLTTATQLAKRGARVKVLERYLIPGGSAGSFEREGYTFDVGSSMMFGFGEEGTTNLLTRALAAVGRRLETVPDPVQIHYHLPPSERHPDGLNVKVHRLYEDFLSELISKFPHEEKGIRAFYGECWNVFNALNTLELKSLEEPRYLLEQFVNHPIACLTLVRYVGANTGDIARAHISDPELLRFIDIECYCWSTVDANLTPMINAGMVFCDRHFGGINYPIGGVGKIAVALAEGLEEMGSEIEYKANVKSIILEEGRAVGVKMADGREIRAKAVISNATRWDTFESLLPKEEKPEPEKSFLQRYKKAASFLSLHLGVEASVLENEPDCHHIVVEDWGKMEEPYGTLFVSMPSLLDPSVAPPERHIVHAFTLDWIEDFNNLDRKAYCELKEERADAVISHLEAIFPGLRAAIRYREVGTPKTHRRFLGRVDGSYGPIPSRTPRGMLGMPFNTTAIDGLYCVGDSTFPGQGVNAVAFSGMACGHRVAADLGIEEIIPGLDTAFRSGLDLLRESV